MLNFLLNKGDFKIFPMHARRGVLKCLVGVDWMIIIYFDVPAKSLPMDESAAGLLDITQIICHKNFLWPQVTLKSIIKGHNYSSIVLICLMIFT